MSCSLSDGKDYSYQDTVNVIYDYSKKISKENSIELMSYGLDYAGADKVYDGKIHVIDLSYAVDRRIQYEEARLLFYELIDGLLKKINSTEYLAKYFSNNPVGYEDLFVKLSFDYYNKGFLKKGDVSQIYIYLDKVRCHTIEVEKAAKIEQKEVIPDVFILEEYVLKESMIEENPYTKEIIRRRPCPTSPKPIKDIEHE